MGGRVDNPPATILVVDDNEANRLLARGTLEDEGYRVIVADGGAEAVSLFEREAPDAVLLDVRMPEVDGFAACGKIRALPGGADVPVLFLTALRDVDTFDHALRAGGDDFLTKPVRPAELVVRVQTALKLRRMSVELREHYALMKQQRDDLLRLQLQKERLTAFVVHDLKNPVNVMDLHAQVLLREKGLPASARESASRIRAEARQLNRMILNLLDLSKADEGKLIPNLSTVDLRATVEEMFAELDARASSRKIVLHAAIEVDRVIADADLLRRILTNLVDNAIRYAPEGSTVEVSTAASPAGTEIRVADEGAGIPREKREKIFDPFVQIESGAESSVRSGRGLGLAFCKLAVEAHGGSIGVEDGGPRTVFRVMFPKGA